MTTAPAWRDPIVSDIHAIREQLAERFCDDLAAYSEAAAVHCRELGFRMVPSGADGESDTHYSNPNPTATIPTPGNTDLTAR